MRYCTNEEAHVFEEAGSDLAVLLRDAADTLDEYEHTFANVIVGQSVDEPYLVTVYLH